ncbi:MAG: hypothetical protein J6S91_01890, partial [Treponema sp.]|nr:hypothetical protein [Treponema sp.]
MYHPVIKIDSSIMQKARAIASRFPGKEEKAAEIAALLLEEGIDPDDSMILALLDLCGGQYGSQEGQKGQNQQDDSQNKGDDGKDSGFLEKIYGKTIPDKTGLLTYLTQVSRGRQHWIFLPYEWDIPQELAENSDGKTEKKAWAGMIRLLIDTEEHNLKKIQINCQTDVTKYFFVLYYNGISNEKEVRFFTLPPLLPSAVQAEEMRLGGFFSSGMSEDKPVTVTYSDSAYFDGLCVTNETPTLIQEKI